MSGPIVYIIIWMSISPRWIVAFFHRKRMSLNVTEYLLSLPLLNRTRLTLSLAYYFVVNSTNNIVGSGNGSSKRLLMDG